MSLIPYLLEIERSRRRADQLLTSPFNPEELLNFVAPQCSNDFLRNWIRLSGSNSDIGSSIRSDRGKFQVNLDVQHFAPEEISVKTVDGFVVVEAKHDERKDEHGWVSRQFIRRCPLPDGCNVESVESRLSSDGVLTVTAPLNRPQATNERVVPIMHTGPVKTWPGEVRQESGDGESGAKIPVENGQ